MKHTKQRRHRKAVTFFTACFGFRKPFKVLCDGTFVHNLIVHRVAPADKAISTILSSPVKLFTTRCVLEELRRLGSSHSETLAAARTLAIARCDHEGTIKTDSCILEIVKDNNHEHFFVASQDAYLRKKLQEIPAVPVIFCLRNALFLEQPSKAQREFVKDSEEQRLHATEKEKKMLEKRTGVIMASMEPKHPDDDDDLGDLNRGTAAVAKKMQSVERELAVKDKPRFKRKKAKGPNPLSCKKKKTNDNGKPASDKGKEAASDGMRSRGRARKRSHKLMKPVAVDNRFSA